MSSDQQHTFGNCTPGRWAFSGPDEYADCEVRSTDPEHDDYTVWRGTQEHDGRLIALAPEMAEAILAYFGGDPARVRDASLHSVAAKLRVIGGDHA